MGKSCLKKRWKKLKKRKVIISSCLAEITERPHIDFTKNHDSLLWVYDLLSWLIKNYLRKSNMTYIFYTLLFWCISGMLSVYFRMLELKKEVILMPKQLVTQIAFFAISALIFWEFFANIVIDLWFIKLWWFLIFMLFSSVSYYAVQVFYEYFSWNKLFADEAEMKRYIEKLEQDKF